MAKIFAIIRLPPFQRRLGSSFDPHSELAVKLDPCLRRGDGEGGVC